MKKSIKKLGIICLSLLVVYLAGNTATQIAYGESLPTVIKQIVEKHVYYINDIEVSKDEFETAQSKVEEEIIEKIIEHRLYTKTVYKINGNEVSKEEYDNCLKGTVDKTTKTNTETITISKDDFSVAGIARLSDYISLTETEAKVYSDKVIKVSFNYSAGYLANFQNGKFTSYGIKGLVYQDTTKTDGFYFTVGAVKEEGYALITEADVSVGDYLFKIEQNDKFAEINFEDVFDSITITITK